MSSFGLIITLLQGRVCMTTFFAASITFRLGRAQRRTFPASFGRCHALLDRTPSRDCLKDEAHGSSCLKALVRCDQARSPVHRDAGLGP